MSHATRRRACAALLSLGASLAASFAAAPALAVTKDECVDANTRAQVLRRQDKLAAARAELQVCADASCPEVVRADCTQRLDELTAAQPTLVLDVKDIAGADLVAVTVKVDGQPLTDKLDGSALAVEPGPHTFTFEVAGQPPVTLSIVIKEGEKQRHERVVVGVAPARSEDGGAAAAARRARTRELVGLVAGGVGVAGIAVGSAFGALAMSRWSRAKSECSATSCPSTAAHAAAVSDHDATVTFGAVSTAGFVAGGALLVTGAALFFTGRRDLARATARSGIAPLVGPGLAGLSAWGSF